MHELRQPSDEAPLADGPSGPTSIHLLWVGDAVPAQRLTSRRAPHIRIEETTAHDAIARLRAGERLPELLVLDVTLPSMESMRVFELFETEACDLPVVLLTPPGNDALPSRAARLGACDCIVKTPDFVHQLLPTITQVRARHELLTIVRIGGHTEERAVTSELEPLEEALRQARADAEALRAERDLAQSERQAAESRQDDANRHVMTALRDVELEREGLLDEVRALKASVDTLTEQRSVAEGAAEAARVSERHQAETITQLEHERHRLASELQAALSAPPALEPGEREHFTASLESAHSRSNALADTIEQLQAGLRQADERQRHDAEAIARLEAENRSLREELMHAGEETRARADEAAAVRGEADALRASIVAEREQWTRATQEAEAAHAAAILDIAVERDQLAQAVIEADERSAAIEHAARTGAVTAEQTAMTELRRQLEAAEARASHLIDRMRELQAEADQLRSSGPAMNALRNDLQAAEGRCAHLVGRLAEMQAAADRAEADRLALTASLAAAEKRLSDVAILGLSIRADRDDLDALRQALTRFLIDTDMRCKAMSARHADLLTALKTE